MDGESLTKVSTSVVSSFIVSADGWWTLQNSVQWTLRRFLLPRVNQSLKKKRFASWGSTNGLSVRIHERWNGSLQA
jgi:hypothetical protein